MRKSEARTRGVLVIGEIALAIVLLSGAELLLRTIARLRDVDLGFQPDHVSAFSLGQLPRKYATKQQEIAFTRTLLHELRALPGVSATDVSFNLPLTGSGPLIPFQIRGEPLPHAAAEARSAGPQYFSAMGIPLLRGRMFSERDIAGAAPVVLISAEVARRWFPNEEPIGKVIETQWSGPGFPGERFGGVVIGVVGDVRQAALEQSKAPTIYMPYQQWPINEYDVVIRSTFASATTLAAARRVLEQLDADIPMNDARPFGDIVDAALGQRRMYLMLLGAFAAVALVLAAVGVYGVTAYGVEQRRREIGIRLALGATSQRVLRMVLSNGLRPVASGILLGLAAALALTRVLDDLLFQVTTRDPVTFVVVPIVLSAVAVLACIFPARRAARLDPMETIRAY